MIHLNSDVIHGLLLAAIVCVLADRWAYGRRTDALAAACREHGVDWDEPASVWSLIRGAWRWLVRREQVIEPAPVVEPATNDFAKVLIEDALGTATRIDPAEEEWRRRFGLMSHTPENRLGVGGGCPDWKPGGKRTPPAALT